MEIFVILLLCLCASKVHLFWLTPFLWRMTSKFQKKLCPYYKSHFESNISYKLVCEVLQCPQNINSLVFRRQIKRMRIIRQCNKARGSTLYRHRTSPITLYVGPMPKAWITHYFLINSKISLPKQIQNLHLLAYFFWPYYAPPWGRLAVFCSSSVNLLKRKKTDTNLGLCRCQNEVGKGRKTGLDLRATRPNQSYPKI